MNIDFAPLLTLAVSHGFFGVAPQPLMRFLVPPATQSLLAGAQVRSRVHQGAWWLLAEQLADEALGEALIGQRLTLGLRPIDEALTRYTAPVLPPAPGSRRVPLWTNAGQPNAFDAPVGVLLCGRRPRMRPLSPQRPLRWRITDPQGALLCAGRLGLGDDDPVPPIDLPDGRLDLQERDDANVLLATQPLLVEPTLAAESPWGLVQLRIDASFSLAPVHFQIALAARQDLLRYYVIAKGYGQSETDSLIVEDITPGLPPGGQIGFARLDSWPADVPNDPRLPRPLVDPGDGARVILFEAQGPATRGARPLHRLQLRSDTRVLVERLPQPGAARSDAQFIVHLTQS